MPHETKQPSIQIKLGRGNYELLIKALETNGNDYDGFTSEMAKKLKHKAENCACIETVDGDDNIYSLHFDGDECENFVWQFLAAASVASMYRDSNSEKSKIIEEYVELTKKYEQIVTTYHASLSEATRHITLTALLLKATTHLIQKR